MKIKKIKILLFLVHMANIPVTFSLMHRKATQQQVDGRLFCDGFYLCPLIGHFLQLEKKVTYVILLIQIYILCKTTSSRNKK